MRGLIRKNGPFVGVTQTRHAAAHFEVSFRRCLTLLEARRAHPAYPPKPRLAA